MPATLAHNDAVRVYLTGAASHDAAQTDPDASLGKYKSSTRVAWLGNTRTNAISNITVDFVHPTNGTGAGQIAAKTVNTLAWTPPGGTEGAAVTIANGETKILEGGNSEYEKYVTVTRTDANDLTGTETDTLADVFNNALGFDNVESAEASAGDDEVRCICFKNESSSTIKDLKVWVGTLGTQFVSGSAQLPASGAGTIGIATGSFDTGQWEDQGWCHITVADGTFREIVYYTSRTATVLTVPAAGRERLGSSAAAGAATDKIYPVPGIALGKEAPTGGATNGYFEDETGDEDVKPAAVGTWDTGITSATGLDIGDLATLEQYGVWIWREMPASSTATSLAYNAIAWEFKSV